MEYQNRSLQATTTSTDSGTIIVEWTPTAGEAPKDVLCFDKY